jgi:Type VI secretion system/phage-baseplate injector OB domain
MSQILSTLAELNRLKAQLAELPNRVYGLQIGIVTDNADPLNQRCIRVSPQSKAGLAPTDWLGHCNPAPAMDAPIPAVGSTVYFQFLDGDPHDGVWLGVTHNDTNPPDPTQSDPVRDCAVEVQGNDRRTIIGNSTHQTVGDRIDETDQNHVVKIEQTFALTTSVGEINLEATNNKVTITGLTEVRLEDGSGGYIVMSGGQLRFGNASGQEWVMGGASGTEWTWNANNGIVNVIAAQDFKINGKSIIVVGSQDSRGDINNDKGY